MTIDAAAAAAVVVVVVVAAAAAAEVAGIVLAAVARPGEAGSEPVEQVSAKCSALAEDAAVVVVVVVGLLAGWHLPTLPGWDSGVEAVAPNPRGSEIH